MAGTSSTAKPSHTAPPPASVGWVGIVFTLAAIVVAIIILRLPELTTGWLQRYDPMGHWWLSTIIASLPVIVLLGALAFGHVKAHYAALAGLITALLTAVLGFGMPARMAATTTVYGLAYGLFPIGWIVLNVIFLYQLTVEAGRFEVLKHSLTGITQDRRLQLLLIAFSFGAFFEGAAGFGTPVAVTAALLIGLGFRPLQASGLSLIANTAPVAYGALGTPIIALAGVTGFSEITLGAMAGRILAVVLCAGAVLVDLGVCRILRDDRDLACRSRGRSFVRHFAVLHFQPSRTVAGGCDLGSGFDDLPDRIPDGLASQAGLDV